jgi:truncated hemoglobin YjbI
MFITSYPNYEPSHGYMSEKIQQKYIAAAIHKQILPAEAHRIPELISLSASNNFSKPIQFWQLYSVLGRNNIVSIVKVFYTKVYQQETWFRSVFAHVGDQSHHVKTQSSMWLDVMGGGFKYHGAEFRLNFHHQHNAFEIMNQKGAERWLTLMVETLDECAAYMGKDERVRVSINTFLSYFMEKYATDFGFNTNATFSPTNAAVKRTINFFNMSDSAIEALSEGELREALTGRRGVTIDEHTNKHQLVQKAKRL